MGKNLVLNMADHGFSIAVCSRTTEKTREFVEKEIASRGIRGGFSFQEFINLQ
jgi:6-phosphogluconate dehydrogenase